MQVAVTNGAVSTSAGGDPTTNEQSVTSEVTVKDGETVVIGGIYSTSEIKNFTAVPYLHKIPIIGGLFKSTLPNSQAQDELLVFLTPRILDRSILKPEDGANISLSY
jgi:type IV pilus assembly protein PilQ